jgi:iron complex outermembrane receptor protein
LATPGLSQELKTIDVESDQTSNSSIDKTASPQTINVPVRKIRRLSESNFVSQSVEKLAQSPTPNPSPTPEIVEVTGIQVNPTEKGVEIVLQTAKGDRLQVSTRNQDKAYIVDIPNAQLRLPEGNTFRREQPSSGITEVTVTNQNANSIQVIILGEADVPQIELFDSDEGLIFAVTPSVSTSQQPQTPEQPATETQPEEQPATETQPEQPATDPQEPIELVVTATRTEEELENVPRSVTIIRREQIEQQQAVSRDLSDIIGRLTPGAGPPTGTIRNQFVRGRGAQILIDGVPVTSNDSNVGFNRDLRSISPNAVERVEVVRGASAVYGDGATGGVINIITRKPTEQGVKLETNVGVDASLSNLQEDSFGNFFSQSISIQQDNVDVFALFANRNTGIAYDAAGDRIPYEENTAETETLEALAKVGINFDSNQRLQISANYNRDRIDPSITADPSSNVPQFSGKVRATEFNPQYINVDEPFNENTALNLSYNHDDLFGSKLNAQAYYRSTRIIPLYFDGRIFDPEDPLGISSRDAKDDKWGGRLLVETPLFETANVSWGVDYSKAHLEDDTLIFDPVDFDNSDGRVLRLIERRTNYPRFSIENLGLFGQAKWDINPNLLLSGGLRYEKFDIDVPDFTNSFLEDIGGGKRSLDDVVFNVGLVYKPTEEVSLYANFAQGLSLAPIARILFANATAGFDFDRDVDLSELQKVNNYEIGVRGNWRSVQASVALFYSESDLGSALVENPDKPGVLNLARAPQRNYGVEATLDWQVDDKWLLGSTFTLQGGENDIDGDGSFAALSSTEVPPLKLTAYVQHQTTPGWSNRLQALFVGDRRQGFEAGSDLVPVDSYLTVDYISNLKIGTGSLELGIENLFNEQYTTPGGSLGFDLGGNFYELAGRGRTVRLNYRFTW